MKTQLKLSICVLAIITVVSTACKGQPGSASKSNKVLDSLKITDADEIKICTLYDQVVTEYLNQMKELSTSGTQPTAAQAADISKKYQQQVKAIQPQIDSFKKNIAANPQEALKFAQFYSYEATRLYGGMSKYQQGIYKSYGVPANH
jgi:gas vesicle protein